MRQAKSNGYPNPLKNIPFISVKDLPLGKGITGPFLVIAEWFDAAVDITADTEGTQPALEDLQVTHTPGYLLGVTNPGTPRACLVLTLDKHPKSLETKHNGQYHLPVSIVWRVVSPETKVDYWPKIKQALGI